MDIEFWQHRWREREIGFHEGKPNELLQHHIGLLAGRRRVLVPLAGKTVDLLLLAAHGLEVVGVEAVAAPCHELFTDNGLDYQVHGNRFVSGAITIVNMDIFACARVNLGTFDAVWDRAALVALEPSSRGRYVDTIGALLEPGARTLLVAFDYDQSKASGPPWSVEPAAVHELFAGSRVETVVTRPGKIGVLERTETLYSITRPTPADPAASEE